MAVQSLRFILLYNFGQQQSLDSDQELQRTEERCDDFPFYKFAPVHWPELAHRARSTSERQSSGILDLEKELLHPKRSIKYKNWLTTFCLYVDEPFNQELDAKEKIMERTVKILLGRKVSTLHIAAGFNLVDVGMWLINLGAPEYAKPVGPTMLDFAVAGILSFTHSEEHQLYCLDIYGIYKEPRLRAALLAGGETISESAFWESEITMFEIAWLIADNCGTFSSLQCVLESG